MQKMPKIWSGGSLKGHSYFVPSAHAILVYRQCTYPAKRIYDGEEIASALARRHLKKNRTDEPVSSASCSNPTFPQDDTNAETGASRFSVDKQHEPLDLLIALGRNTRMGGFYIDSSRPPDFLKLAFPLEDDLKCVSVVVNSRAKKDHLCFPSCRFITVSLTL